MSTLLIFSFCTNQSKDILATFIELRVKETLVCHASAPIVDLHVCMFCTIQSYCTNVQYAKLKKELKRN